MKHEAQKMTIKFPGGQEVVCAAGAEISIGPTCEVGSLEQGEFFYSETDYRACMTLASAVPDDSVEYVDIEAGCTYWLDEDTPVIHLPNARLVY